MLDVVADADVLYGNDQRNIFVVLSLERAFALRGTDEIESEWTRNLIASKRSFDPERTRRTAERMRVALPN